jgi:hypothetical protein
MAEYLPFRLLDKYFRETIFLKVRPQNEPASPIRRLYQCDVSCIRQQRVINRTSDAIEPIYNEIGDQARKAKGLTERKNESTRRFGGCILKELRLLCHWAKKPPDEKQWTDFYSKIRLFFSPFLLRIILPRLDCCGVCFSLFWSLILCSTISLSFLFNFLRSTLLRLSVLLFMEKNFLLSLSERLFL